MFRWLLFLHIIGVAFWLGSMGSARLLIGKAVKAPSTEALNLTTDTLRGITRGIVIPSALLSLVTGVAMILQMALDGGKPFWLAYMEMFGGLVIMLSVGLLLWQMRRLQPKANGEAVPKRLVRLGHTYIGMMAAVASVVLVVALRIA